MRKWMDKGEKGASGQRRATCWVHNSYENMLLFLASEVTVNNHTWPVVLWLAGIGVGVPQIDQLFRVTAFN